MSTFSGRTKEYPFVSIDRFDGENLKNLTFLLSHNHRDHTIGLFKDKFIYKLQGNSEMKLYCSPVTKDLLMLEDDICSAIQKFPHISKSIVALETEESHSIAIIDPENGKTKETITVTLLPAKHCPGSVMFLIEGHIGTILYTGDFRLDRKDFERMSHLKTGDSVKNIKSLYVDTTFCVPEAMYIPSREESVENAIHVIGDWINQSPHHVVHLKHAANLGYEQFYREISSHFNMKVHVSRKKFAEYRKIGDVHTFTTPNPAVTQIHACKSMEHGSWKRGNHKLPCGYVPPHRGDELFVRTIKVSTMAFVQHVGTEKCIKMHNDNFYRICYSFHPSYCELRDIIMYLKPGRAFPNVIPMQCTEKRVQERLNHFLKMAHKSRTPNASQEARPLGQLKPKRKRTREPSSQYSDDLAFDFMDDSPAKKSKSEVKPLAKTLSKSEDSKAEKTSPKQESQKQDEDKSTEKDQLCDPKAFPMLFGIKSDNDSDHEKYQETNDNQGNHSQISENGSKKNSENSFHEFSQDLFAESDDESDLIPDDKELMKNFTPAAGGSFGDLVGYISDDAKDNDEDIDTDEEDGGNQRAAKDAAFMDTGQHTSKTLTASGDNQNAKKRYSFTELKPTSLPLSSRLKRHSLNDENDSLNHSSASDVKIMKHQYNKGSSSSGSPTSEQKPTAASLEIVDISEPEDNSDSEVEFSGRKRRLSENPLDTSFSAATDSKGFASIKHRTGRNARDLQRSSVVRFPGYVPRSSFDHSHADRGYQNLMTNIEKILKSPTRSSLSDETDQNDVVVVNDSPNGNEKHKQYHSRSHHHHHHHRKYNGSSTKHEKFRKRKHQPSASLSKPVEENVDQKESSETNSLLSGVKSESSRSNWFDNGEDECIDLTAEDDANDDAKDRDSDVISDGSHDLISDASHDVISDEDDVNDDPKDDSAGGQSDEKDVESDDDAICDADSLAQNETFDVISDESDEDVVRDQAVTQLNDTENFGDIEGYENGASDYMSDEERTRGSKRSNKRKHKRHRRPHYELNSYSSDSDMDSAGSYESDEWFLEVSRVRKAMKQTDKGKSRKLNISVSSTEVIVLDDSSSCSMTRPSSVSVSTQVTDFHKVSPLAHRSSESVLQLPSLVPKSWSRYATQSCKPFCEKYDLQEKRSKSEGDIMCSVQDHHNKDLNSHIRDAESFKEDIKLLSKVSEPKKKLNDKGDDKDCSEISSDSCPLSQSLLTANPVKNISAQASNIATSDEKQATPEKNEERHLEENEDNVMSPEIPVQTKKFEN